MKIVIVGPAHPYRGGIALFNERLAKAYLDKGAEVELVTFTLQYPSFLFPGKTQYSDTTAPKNLKIHRWINSVNPLSWFSVARKIKSLNPDLVIVAYWLPFMAASLGTIAKRLKQSCKVIALTHNMLPHEPRIGDKQLSNYFVKSVHGFLTLSDSVANDIKTFSSKPVKVTYHPLYDNFGESISKETAIKNLQLDTDYRYLLFFGIVRKYKGLDVLLESIPLIKDEKVKIIVAGEFYDDEAPYLSLIEKNELKNKVIFKNQFIADEDVVNYFCACDMVVQPYKTATQSGVTQIAYHFSKPMLVTNVGGLAEMVPHNKVGYSVECNPKSVANSINDFFDNKKETQFIANVEKEKEKYSWENMISSIDELVAKI